MEAQVSESASASLQPDPIELEVPCVTLMPTTIKRLQIITTDY